MSRISNEALSFLLRTSLYFHGEDASYSFQFPNTNIDTSNLDKPIREYLSMLHFRPKKDVPKDLVRCLALGIFADGSSILAEVGSYSPDSRRLGLILRTPKKRYRYFKVSDFDVLLYSRVWVGKPPEEKKPRAKRTKRKKEKDEEGPLLPLGL